METHGDKSRTCHTRAVSTTLIRAGDRMKVYLRFGHYRVPYLAQLVAVKVDTGLLRLLDRLNQDLLTRDLLTQAQKPLFLHPKGCLGRVDLTLPHEKGLELSRECPETAHK